MAEDIFRIQGRVLHDDGQPAEGVVLAIVDEDPMQDDLIGVGVTDARGEFRLSFTKAAFNQDALEMESYPDIYVVASRREPGGLVPVLRQSFPGLGFLGGMEDLGNIRLGTLTPLAGQEPVPGQEKIARRLKLDDETLANAAAEVAPLVESLTGWEHLLGGVKLHISESLGHTFAGVVEAAEGADLRHRVQAERVFNSALALSGIVALYDPFARTIHVSRRALERQNLDALKVILGHELVHVGQFREHPALIEEQRPMLKMTAARMRGEVDHEAAPAPDEFFGWMANLEGYAAHIEHDFLRKHYNCAVPLQHASALELFASVGAGFYGLLRSTLDGASWEDQGEQGGSKLNQYGAGLRAYRARRQGEKPAAFDPRLRPSNTAGDELDTALLEEKASWGDLEATYGLARRLLSAEGPEADPTRGLKLLRDAAEAGHGLAQCELGSRYFGGVGVEVQYDQFVYWTRKAMAADVPRAFYNMGLAHYLEAGVPEDAALSFRFFQEALDRGYERARVEVGSRLLRGQGVAADIPKATTLLEEAARHGDAEASFWLGTMCDQGVGGPVDQARAVQLFRKAAEGKFWRAWKPLGLAYELGRGVEVDPAEALRCFLEAAAVGDLDSKNTAGVRLLQGRGAPRDAERGLSLLTEAARANHLDAMHNLALAHLNQDPSFGELPLAAEEGLAWLTRAADAGRVGSQVKLGQVLLGGQLCPPDHPRAAAWIRRAADANVPFAQYLYGLCALEGLGIPRDQSEAKEWLRKAAAGGNTLAQERLARLESP